MIRWPVLAASALLALGALGACGSPEGGGGGSEAAAPSCNRDPVTTKTGLKYENLDCGTGKAARPGDVLTVHYTGWLADGTKFDSSLDRNEPFPFTLGAGQVIPGWDQGLEGMKVGGKRKLTIPPDLAYGAQGSPPVIPPNSTLVFEVELLKIKGGGP